MNPTLKIGELAKRTGTLVQTVRYYEQEGLLAEPARSQANHRLYSEAHVDAPEENCGRANALLDEHIEQVASRFRELNLLEQNLRRLRSHCHRTEAAKHCGILQSLSATPKAPLRSSLGHRNSRLFRTHK
jgi:MerR family regulatory protein